MHGLLRSLHILIDNYKVSPIAIHITAMPEVLNFAPEADLTSIL